MTLHRRLIPAIVLTLSVASSASSQWEWAGGIPISLYSAVGSAGRWIFLNGYYAGDRMAFSPDAGESWSVSSLGPSGKCFTLAAAGTDTVLFTLYGNTVFKSPDWGPTWVKSDSGLGGASVRGLAYSSGAGSPRKGILMAAALGTGMFVSTDAGASWQPADSGLSSLMTQSVVASDTVFFAGTADRGVFRTFDNGVTWSPSDSGLTGTAITALASAAGQVFAASGTNVYRSRDRGSSWELMSRTLPAPALNIVLVPTPGKSAVVAAFAVTDSGSYRLAYEDSSWTRVFVSTGIYDRTCVLAAADTALYAVSQQMVARSVDLGETWLPLGALSGAEVVSGHVSSKCDHPRLYAGLYSSTNFGSSWVGLRPVTYRSKVTAFSVCQDTSLQGYDQLIIGTDSGKVEISSDGGRSWEMIKEPDEVTRYYQCLDVAELDGIAFVSLQMDRYHHPPLDSIAGVYRTTNGGFSWEKMNTAGLTDSLVLSLDLFRAKSGGRILFAGGWYHLFRSTDDGETWTENTATPIRTGRKFLQEVNGTLFLCTQGTVNTYYNNDGSLVQIFDSAGVYKSTDEGLTWIEVTGNLHSAFVRGFAVASIPQEPSRTYLAACSDAAVFTSSQGGKQWEAFGNGLSWFTFGGPVGADDKYVYLGLFGLRRRPWTDAVLTSAGPVQADHPSRYSLSQNYPNPFNPSTTISYSLPAASHVSLTVFDLLGREVAVLVNDRMEPGVHEVRFDASGLASGVYLYKLEAGSFVQTRKLMLLR
jgi:photosystem II stability/assembly factor-like uncharacterized protein